MEFHDICMTEYAPSIAAAKKLGELPAGFAFYSWGIVGGIGGKNTMMECTGAVFRAAKTGPRRGRRVVMVPNTIKTVYVTSEEIAECRVRKP